MNCIKGTFTKCLWCPWQISRLVTSPIGDLYVSYGKANKDLLNQRPEQTRTSFLRTKFLNLCSCFSFKSTFQVSVLGFKCSNDISKPVCIPDNYSKFELPHTGKPSKLPTMKNESFYPQNRRTWLALPWTSTRWWRSATKTTASPSPCTSMSTGMNPGWSWFPQLGLPLDQRTQRNQCWSPLVWILSRTSGCQTLSYITWNLQIDWRGNVKAFRTVDCQWQKIDVRPDHPHHLHLPDEVQQVSLRHPDLQIPCWVLQ